MSQPSFLAVIPARGGSKGVPRKNIKLLASRPLIAWTIDAALRTQQVTRVVVSTDDPEIASVSREAGAEVPFLRPAELALDTTPGVDPIIHAVEWLEASEGFVPDYVLCLQPTSPLRSAEDIGRACKLIVEKLGQAVVSVVEPHHHPYWMRTMAPDGILRPFVADAAIVTRRQELPPVFALNGAIYVVQRSVLLAERTLFPARTYGLVMPVERSLDIDSRFDFAVAEAALALTSREETGSPPS